MSKCTTKQGIINAGGKVIQNLDGSVSAFVQGSGVGGLSPLILNKACCLALDPTYVFDIDTQKCMWKTPVNCATNDSYSITNDQAIFNGADNETCSLNIEFDYLFKISCKSLIDMLTYTGASTSFVSSEIKEQIRTLENEISDQIVLCETISNQIEMVQAQIDSTPYSISCNHNFTNSQTLSSIPTSSVQSFSNSGFGDSNQAPVNGTGNQLSTSSSQNVGTYCLMDAGLVEFQTLLGTAYTLFIAGDPN